MIVTPEPPHLSAGFVLIIARGAGGAASGGLVPFHTLLGPPGCSAVAHAHHCTCRLVSSLGPVRSPYYLLSLLPGS